MENEVKFKREFVVIGKYTGLETDLAPDPDFDPDSITEEDIKWATDNINRRLATDLMMSISGNKEPLDPTAVCEGNTHVFPHGGEKCLCGKVENDILKRI